MDVKSKLALFREDNKAMADYRSAITLLQRHGVDTILLQLGLPEPINPLDPKSETAAVANLYEHLGFQKCVALLFSLDEIPLRPVTEVIADYGANAKMGITEEEAREWSNE